MRIASLLSLIRRASAAAGARHASGVAALVFAAAVGLAGLTGWAPEAAAFEQWSTNGGDTPVGYCSDCHGNFNGTNYTSFKDGVAWGRNLHNGHRNFMLSGDCNVCHSAGDRFPVLLNSSAGGVGFDPISCVGCHGREEDRNNGQIGAGLRQHHTNSGAAFCGGCHQDNNPATFTTVAENAPPPYYFTPDAVHPGKPTDACDGNGSESVFGMTGLDNDGDLLDDATDSDCGAPGGPDIALDPTSLDFGVVFIGGTSTLTSQVRNLGGSDLVVSAVALCAGTSSEFGFVPLASTVIPAGGSETLSVSYTPVDGGTDTGCISIASNDSDEPNVPLALSGTADPGPDIGLSEMVLDFGPLTVGTSSTLSTQIQNLGTSDLVVSDVAACVGTSAEFAFANPAPLTIPAGGAQTLSVTYMPVDVGDDPYPPNCLAIDSNDFDEPTIELGLTGIGIGACDIDVAPLALGFGTVPEGSTNTLSTTVGNTGAVDCTVDSLAVSGSADFFLGAGAPVTPFDVAPGALVDVPVTYSPPAPGADSGTLSIASDDADEAVVDVALSGAVAEPPPPDIDLLPAVLDFGPVNVGDSPILTSEIRNLGGSDLIVGTVDLCAGTSSEFAFVPLASTVIPAGGSETLSVIYAPMDGLPDSGCIAIASNDPDESTVELGLSGTGIPLICALEVTPLLLDFGVVFVGDTATVPATLQNAGTDVCQVTGIVPTPGTSTEFGFTPTAPFAVAAGGSQTLAVTYAPVDAGPDAGSLEIISDDPANPVIELGLRGEGGGAPDIDLEPPHLAFGNVAIGGMPTLSAEIRNLGNLDLAVFMIDLCVGTSTEYSFASDPLPIIVPPGGSRAVSVTYMPVDVGMDTGCLEVLSNDPDESLVELGLSGSGSGGPPMAVVMLKVPGAINPENNGVTPIKFWADMVDLEIAFVECGPAAAEPERLNMEDVNADGYRDVVGLFETRALGIACGDETLTCTGTLADGTMFESVSEPFTTVGRVCKPGKVLAKSGNPAAR